MTLADDQEHTVATIATSGRLLGSADLTDGKSGLQAYLSALCAADSDADPGDIQLLVRFARS